MPCFIALIAERRTGLKMSFYDFDANHLPFGYSCSRFEKPVPRPANLDEMIEIAKQLCKGLSGGKENLREPLEKVPKRDPGMDRIRASKSPVRRSDAIREIRTPKD